MTNPVAPTGTETHIRAIVYREGGLHIAQCLDYDIAVQAADVDAVLKRLKLTLEAEFAICREDQTRPCDCIAPAPTYYHGLWERRSDAWTQHWIHAPLEIAFVNVTAEAA